MGHFGDGAAASPGAFTHSWTHRLCRNWAWLVSATSTATAEMMLQPLSNSLGMAILNWSYITEARRNDVKEQPKEEPAGRPVNVVHTRRQTLLSRWLSKESLWHIAQRRVMPARIFRHSVQCSPNRAIGLDFLISWSCAWPLHPSTCTWRTFV